MTKTLRTATFALTGLAALGSALAADANPLEAERWKTRPLVVVAPRSDDPLLRRVEETLSRTAPREAFIEREMVFYRVVAGTGSRDGRALTAGQTRALLAALGLRADAPAQLVLVGKDGGAKVRQAAEVDLDEIFRTIDRMPMRQTGR
ncbi:DUF4174 domain-containing protein [Pseudacidovorax sp. RU35E]|uniref:DUF4174 domain-containing protein n=1 Tax=Pseudacidovorax sp. RU35E TaxID=1907403 RepID=UPI000956F5DB|nr:DUF4174 domain-containing protein [Pseudacidovorax sp. RU35E]SIR59443.1 protein of unknown function [Pseudacidovorax sp. RU35E]